MGAEFSSTRSQASKQGPVKSDRFQPWWCMETFSGDLRWQPTMWWRIREEEIMDSIRAAVALWCHVTDAHKWVLGSPDSLWHFEKLDQHKRMEFLKFKRFSLRGERKRKRKDCFLKIRQSLGRHTKLLLPNVSHYHSEYFCLKFMALWFCFPSYLSLSKEALLICNLKNNSPQTFSGSCYLVLHFLLSNGIQFLLILTWILLFSTAEAYISISTAFCPSLVDF